jgi:hypothetical protein
MSKQKLRTRHNYPRIVIFTTFPLDGNPPDFSLADALFANVAIVETI